MDVFTSVWYLSTLLALLGFFLIVVCVESFCAHRRHLQQQQQPQPTQETYSTKIPSPAPSYRLFAPPSYDSWLKKYKSRVFIISESVFSQQSTTGSVTSGQTEGSLDEAKKDESTTHEVTVEVEKH